MSVHKAPWTIIFFCRYIVSGFTTDSLQNLWERLQQMASKSLGDQPQIAMQYLKLLYTFLGGLFSEFVH